MPAVRQAHARRTLLGNNSHHVPEQLPPMYQHFTGAVTFGPHIDERCLLLAAYQQNDGLLYCSYYFNKEFAEKI